MVKEIKGENKDIITFVLDKPICSEISERIAVSRKIVNSWRLIGWGEVLPGGEIISKEFFQTQIIKNYLFFIF